MYIHVSSCHLLLAHEHTEDNCVQEPASEPKPPKTYGLEFEDLSVLEKDFNFATGMPSKFIVGLTCPRCTT